MDVPIASENKLQVDALYAREWHVASASYLQDKFFLTAGEEGMKRFSSLLRRPAATRRYAKGGDASSDDMEKLCIEFGLRSSACRRRVIELLRQNPSPLTASDLQVLSMSDGARLKPSAIYRALARLEEAGIVVRLANSGGKARFTLSIPAPEIRCKSICGAEITMSVSSMVEDRLRDVVQLLNLDVVRIDIVVKAGPTSPASSFHLEPADGS